MRILVTFAVDQEFAAWRRMHPFARTNREPPWIYQCRVGAADVRVVLTGAGPVCARRAIQAALRDPADVCIASGLAGGLRSRHRTGDVLAARAVLDGSGTVLETVDPRLLRLAAACGAREVETFLTVARVVPTAREKSRLAASADAVDMESFVNLSEARTAKVPAVAVRVVGDTVEQDLPLDLNAALGKAGEVRVARVLAQLARNPLRLAAVARLGQQTQRAATRLALFLDRFVEALEAGAQAETLGQAVAG